MNDIRNEHSPPVLSACRHYSIHVEVKSLNSKFFDLQLRSPKNLSDKEIEIRAIASKRLLRGKVVICIECESKIDERNKTFLNRDKFKSLYAELKDLAKQMDYKGDELFSLALNHQEISSANQLGETTDEMFNLVREQLTTALDKCCEFRFSEGVNLERELKTYIENINVHRQDVANLEKGRVEKVRSRLQASINELKGEDVDQNRFEQELIYYLEKLDITEELVRLDSHVHYFDKVLKEANPGKKLGFLSQELGREINTIGSKANDAPIQKVVILMKEELEKIKEQSLNVL